MITRNLSCDNVAPCWSCHLESFKKSDFHRGFQVVKVILHFLKFQASLFREV